MLLISLMSMMIIIISLIILMMTTILSMKSMSDREKTSPFECGFDPMNSSRTPFSIHFFMIAIIFIIFDIEIVILLPIPISLFNSNNIYMLLTSMMFISTLLMGLFYEWKMGSLKWIN
uniref:NADH-ubiquinone oxidoreductase chain 3 n=1 Tax=Brachycybe lecontii TaxID=1176341 RepID=S4SZX5_BRALC|nr:NADH dehydrogenase subunit 3 [Brachycybe lecontii]AFR77042.1 NADH dehydrogenase subunit 3 [Brachycybe lecontii]